MDSNNATTNNDNINSTATRKRRLSKKERKSMKKKQKSEQKANEPKRVLNQEDVNQQCHDESSEEREKEIQEEIELMKSYKPISAPKTVSPEIEASKKSNIGPNNDIDEGGSGGGGEKKLGTWFPNALLVKCTYGYTNTGKLVYTGPKKEDIDGQDDPKSAPKSSILLFYQYTKNKWSPDQVKLLMTYFSILAKQRNLGGRIRVAQEGVNATLSAIDMPFRNGLSAKEILRHVAQDLKNFDSEVFTSKTDFKFIDDLPADRHFKEMKIIPVQELVYYGIREEDASCNQGGIHLDAKEYHKMLQKDNAVVIDVRNHYETNLGRFDGQESKKSIESGKGEGAEYIDPKMRKSTDFTAWLAKPETKKKLENKTVLMYCTGGIRCERASAYLKKKMGNEVEGIYQLQGGIERYLKAFPSGGFWRGSNFVFDKREAVSVQEKDGCGGVIRKKLSKKSKSHACAESKCCVCGKIWDRYVGKKKCYTCGVPVLMCDHCMSLKPDKKKELMLKVRCPLCVEEKITVPASKVEFTDNGVKSKFNNSSAEANSMDLRNKNTEEPKAAASICKWGGGHAKQKKLARKMKQTPCRFGKECFRKDCFFVHPS